MPNELPNPVYIPILKAKQGELEALKQARTEERQQILPLLEIPPIPVKWPEGEEDPVPAKTIDQHIAATSEKIASSLRGFERVLIDGAYVEEEETLGSGEEPIAATLRLLREKGLTVVPVVGLDRVQEYGEAVRDFALDSGVGCSLRLSHQDLDLIFDLRSQIESLLAFLHLEPSQTDLIVDFGAKLPIRGQLPALVQDFPFLTDWRTFTLAFAAFPPDMSDIERHSTVEIDRDDWLSWLAVWRYRERLARVPTYADYGINHPSLVEIDPRVMSMSPNIRYTGELHYIVAKGQAYPKGKRKKLAQAPVASAAVQYQRLSREIMQQPEWGGADFSWGDWFIADCAEGNRVGNASQWRAVGTSHHIAFVVRQLASLL